MRNARSCYEEKEVSKYTYVVLKLAEEIWSYNGRKIPLKKSIFSKVEGNNFTKNELCHRYFSRIVTAHFRIPIFQTRFQWLILKIQKKNRYLPLFKNSSF